MERQDVAFRDVHDYLPGDVAFLDLYLIDDLSVGLDGYPSGTRSAGHVVVTSGNEAQLGVLSLDIEVCESVICSDQRHGHVASDSVIVHSSVEPDLASLLGGDDGGEVADIVRLDVFDQLPYLWRFRF